MTPFVRKEENTNIAHLDKVVEMFRAQIGYIHQESLYTMTVIMISPPALF